MPEHWDATPAGRRVVTLLVIAVVAVAAAGAFRTDPVGRQLHAMGVHQPWDVFAPEPVHIDATFWATVAFTDGTTATWRTPKAPDAFPYGTHRWELWEERIMRDAYSSWWEPAARWIAADAAGPGKVPARVVLTRRWSNLPPPGADPAWRRWNEFDFYTIDLR